MIVEGPYGRLSITLLPDHFIFHGISDIATYSNDVWSKVHYSPTLYPNFRDLSIIAWRVLLSDNVVGKAFLSIDAMLVEYRISQS